MNPARRVSEATADHGRAGSTEELSSFRKGPQSHNSGHPGEKCRCRCGPQAAYPHNPSRGRWAELALPGPTHLASWPRRSSPAAAGAPGRRPRRAPAQPDGQAYSTSGASPPTSGTARCWGRGRWGRARAARPSAPQLAGTRQADETSASRRPATSSVASVPSPLSRAPRPHFCRPDLQRRSKFRRPSGKSKEGVGVRSRRADRSAASRNRSRSSSAAAQTRESLRLVWGRSRPLQ